MPHGKQWILVKISGLKQYYWLLLSYSLVVSLLFGLILILCRTGYISRMCDTILSLHCRYVSLFFFFWFKIHILYEIHRRAYNLFP